MIFKKHINFRIDNKDQLPIVLQHFKDLGYYWSGGHEDLMSQRMIEVLENEITENGHIYIHLYTEGYVTQGRNKVSMGGVSEINLTYDDLENLIKLAKEKIRKKEEYREKMKDVDPYGEEDWDMNESVQNYEFLKTKAIMYWEEPTQLKHIKLFEQYIDRSDIDPYGEEDWEYDNLHTVLQIARRQNNKPYDQITVLYCHNNQLTSLEGIEKLVNLEKLICYDNQLTSLKGIENLVNLERLSCSNNQLTSLKGIEKLVNLKVLWYNSNQLTSLEGIENLVNLEKFGCSNNQLTSLEGIEKLVNLKELNCQNNLFSKDYEKYLINYCEKNNIYLNA